ncbi:MarR family transcriptional regulator [Pseudonocardia sp. RS11V-5]|uniref:MarR family winged helix-turn-helix transcriptional regulator n=1 Tax=Pseudonocardia terrae TaxID=2905831 RepID=UPI001E640015|nr:MarR family transcriptional regulator [Pseudonocardia terrae]MCE3552119.1 MarR family transcriptional regulator [Pseudonocardia terrae]
MSEGEETLAEAFWAVARMLRGRNKEALAPWDVTPSQFRAVATLARHGRVRLSTLAEHLRIAPRSATEVVDDLQERGLAERTPDPADRRATLVALTAKGHALAHEVRAARQAQSESLFAGLDERDRADLARILRTLRAAGPEEAGAVPSGRGDVQPAAGTGTSST